MLDRKQNVFDDFVAAAEQLIADGWTTPDQLGACGESNGGLLVGAAITQRPDLFAAAVCSAPLLDMVRYERSGLGPSWRARVRLGRGSGSARLAARLLAVPPRPAGTAYPAVLFTVFDGDTRVDPLHARKMCAALQWASTSGPAGPAAHRARRRPRRAGGELVRSTLAADILAFLAAHTGLQVGEP